MTQGNYAPDPYAGETYTAFGKRVAAARAAAKPFRIPQVTPKGEHNGERWAKAEAERKRALELKRTGARFTTWGEMAITNIDWRPELPKSLGQVAHDACTAEMRNTYGPHGVLPDPWQCLTADQKRWWSAAAQAVRLAVIG